MLCFDQKDVTCHSKQHPYFSRSQLGLDDMAKTFHHNMGHFISDNNIHDNTYLVIQ